MAVIGSTPAGQIESLPNLKRRQLSVYERPNMGENGQIEWMDTRPLPADLQGRELYLSKGFRLKGVKPPVDEEKDAMRAEIAQLRSKLEEKEELGDSPSEVEPKRGRPKKSLE